MSRDVFTVCTSARRARDKCDAVSDRLPGRSGSMYAMFQGFSRRALNHANKPEIRHRSMGQGIAWIRYSLVRSTVHIII